MLGIVVWEDDCTQSLVKPVFYFRMDDKKRFELLFETEGNLKLIWQLSYSSFSDQDHNMFGTEIQATCRRFQ